MSLRIDSAKEMLTTPGLLNEPEICSDEEDEVLPVDAEEFEGVMMVKERSLGLGVIFGPRVNSLLMVFAILSQRVGLGFGSKDVRISVASAAE